MTAEERLQTAIRGGVPDRVPVVPKIWVELAARLTGTALAQLIEDPLEALRVIARAGRQCRVNAVRQFHLPARRLCSPSEKIFEVDAGGELLGQIDMVGGLGTHLSDPGAFDLADPRCVAYAQYWLVGVPLVRDLDDARRISVLATELYVELGCAERQVKVLAELGCEIAVIGDCGSPTMAFLVSMRGMNQAMFDLIE